MMTRDEKVTEAKLMAIEKYIQMAHDMGRDGIGIDAYDYAKCALDATRNEEIKAELADHESNLLTRDEKPE